MKSGASREAVTGLGDTETGDLEVLEHPAIVQARADIALPWWCWEASALFPWGVA